MKQAGYFWKQKQRGQSIALLAISIVTLLGMAALAVNVTTLYVARSGMQRTADAAALAGAEGLAYSGVTSNPSDPALQTLATDVATKFANAVLARNKVGGVTPTLASAPTTDFSHLGNPQITVKVQRTDVPTFFSRIFRVFGSGVGAVTVSATATAEAYNSSNPVPGSTPSMPAVAPSYVKPWLVANHDPAHGGSPFVNGDGSITNPGVWVGSVTNPPPGSCAPSGTGGVLTECITLPNIWAPALTILNVPGYVPAAINNPPSGVCSSCAALGTSFLQSAACSDTANATLYKCGSTTATLDTSADISDTMNGASCLITGATNGGTTVGKDHIYVDDFEGPPAFADPIRIKSDMTPNWRNNVTTSKQVVTMPIIDNNVTTVKVVGYMQAFLQGTTTGGNLVITVLNISGCGTNINTAAPPVSGGTSSPVPVRLIH